MACIGFVLLFLPSIGFPGGDASFPGDSAFARLDYAAAQTLYDSVLVLHPEESRTLWRLARLFVCRGDVAPDDERRQLYREAERCARTCVRISEETAEGHTWLAAALGNIALFEGGRKKVELANEIKRELDRALALNPSDDVAYSILGSFYRALGQVSWLERQLAGIFLGGLPAGGFAESEEALHRAIALAPAVVRHHYELALLYIVMGRTDNARAELHFVELLPVSLARDLRSKEHARDLLRGI
jgi:tetratricopeptide (TPR) repeat protein